MSTVVLYCWCHSDIASVHMYFTKKNKMYLSDTHPPDSCNQKLLFSVPAKQSATYCYMDITLSGSLVHHLFGDTNEYWKWLIAHINNNNINALPLHLSLWNFADGPLMRWGYIHCWYLGQRSRSQCTCTDFIPRWENRNGDYITYCKIIQVLLIQRTWYLLALQFVKAF